MSVIIASSTGRGAARAAEMSRMTVIGKEESMIKCWLGKDKLKV